MDREGGLDEYLLKESEARIKELGPTGWQLRWFLMQQPVVIARLRAEAVALGLAQDIIDKQWPERPKIERMQDETIAKRKQEKALREEGEQKDHAQQLRYRRYKRTAAFSEAALKKGLAPKRTAAEKMGVADANKFFQLMRLIRDEKMVLAYMQAERMGAVERAGGRTTWLARYKANRMYQWQKKHERRQAARMESGELIEDETVQPEKAEESNDAWGDLVKANRGELRAQASA